MLPSGKALIGILAHTGVIGTNVLPTVGCQPTSSALPDIESSGVRVYTGVFHPPAHCSVIRPLLTSRGISSSGSPQVRTRCFPARPPHLPPRLNPRFRCVVSVRRIVDGLNMRFLFVGPPVSSSLPPAGWLPFQRWLQVVVLSHFHVRFLRQGTCTPFPTRPCWAHTTACNIFAESRAFNKMLRQAFA
jgi:hypothetical protein